MAVDKGLSRALNRVLARLLDARVSVCWAKNSHKDGYPSPSPIPMAISLPCERDEGRERGKVRKVGEFGELDNGAKAVNLK